MNKRSEDTKLFKNCRVGVVGDIMLDHYVFGRVHRISPEAPVPIVLVSGESYAPGGAGNTARNMATLGAKVDLLGEIGRDSAADIVLKELKKCGVKTDGVIRNNTKETIEKIRIVGQSGQLLRVDKEKPGSISQETERVIARYVTSHIGTWDVVVISDYAKGVISAALAKKILAQAVRHRVPVVVDTKPKHFSFFKKAAVITPNMKEALETVKMLGGTSVSLPYMGAFLVKVSGSAILLTQGEKGLTLFEKDGATYFRSVAAQDANVVGAGDTVVAALAFALASGSPLKEAAYLANIAAGIAVRKEGTVAVTLSEVTSAVARERLR